MSRSGSWSDAYQLVHEGLFETPTTSGGAEQHSSNWESLIIPAFSVHGGAFDDIDSKVESEQGWDAFFEKAYVGRLHSVEEARLIMIALKNDPSLLTVFLVHEA